MSVSIPGRQRGIGPAIKLCDTQTDCWHAAPWACVAPQDLHRMLALPFNVDPGSSRTTPLVGSLQRHGPRLAAQDSCAMNTLNAVTLETSREQRHGARLAPQDLWGGPLGRAGLALRRQPGTQPLLGQPKVAHLPQATRNLFSMPYISCNFIVH